MVQAVFFGISRWKLLTCAVASWSKFKVCYMLDHCGTDVMPDFRFGSVLPHLVQIRTVVDSAEPWSHAMHPPRSPRTLDNAMVTRRLLA